MRVCQISYGYPRHNHTGAGLVAFKLAELIPAETLFITKCFEGTYVDPPPHTKLFKISCREPSVPQHFSILRAIWITLGKIVGSTCFLLKAIPSIVRFHPDIVHIHTPLPVLFGVFAKLILRCPVVMTFHGTDFLWLRRIKILQWLVDSVVDVVFCVSHLMAEEMTSLMRKPRITTIPNGVDSHFFQNFKRPRQKRIVAVGVLKWQKGYEYLLQAMKILVGQYHSLQLFIAGSGPLHDELRASVTSLGLNDNVRFLGSVPLRKVRELLNDSRVFVMSSVTEGFPHASLA